MDKGFITVVGNWLLWVLLTIAGLAIGLFISQLLLGGSSALGALVGSVILGALVGLAQMVALILLKHTDIATRWLIVTGIGFAVISLFFLSLDAFINVSDSALGTGQVGGGAVAALTMFAGQWMVLRGKFRNAWVWPAASVGSLVISGLVAAAGSTGGTAAIFGLPLYVFITGAALVWMRMQSA